MYDAHERKKEADLAVLKNPASPLNTLEKLTKAVELKLGVEDLRWLDATYLSGTRRRLHSRAAELSLAIEDVFDVELPADSILSPTGSLDKWAKEIERRLGDAGGRPTFASVHGKEATELHAKDLQLATFLGDVTMEQARSGRPSLRQMPDCTHHRCQRVSGSPRLPAVDGKARPDRRQADLRGSRRGRYRRPPAAGCRLRGTRPDVCGPLSRFRGKQSRGPLRRCL